MGEGDHRAEGPGVARQARLVFLLALLALVPFTWARDLFDSDEGVYASVAWGMVESGDWVTPRLNDMVFLDKPPLVYWAQAVPMQVTGPVELVARLPTVLAGALVVLFVFLFARHWSGRRRPAWLAAGVAATSAAVVLHARVGPQMDLPLAACTTGALWAAWLSLEKRTLLRAVGLGAAVGLGLLAKGPLAVVLPGVVVVGWVLAGVELERVVRVAFSPIAWLVALAIAAPWYVLVERANPGWIEHFLVVDHFSRFGEGDYRNFHPFWFYVPVALALLVPWTTLAWAGGGRRGAWRLLDLVTGSPFGRRPWRKALPAEVPLGREGRGVPAWGVAWAWFLAALLLYSASRGKLHFYFLPAMPPLLVLAGLRLDQLLVRRSLRPYLLPALLGVAAVVGGFLVKGGVWIPKATGKLPDEVEIPRWIGLGAYLVTAGGVLLLGTMLARRRAVSVVSAGVILTITLTLFWWCLDLGANRVEHLGSARRIGQQIELRTKAGYIPISLKRYPQGIGFYANAPVWITGGSQDRWRQRVIRNPYAKEAWEARQARERELPEPKPVWDGRGGLLSDDEFERLWASDRKVLLVCRYGEIDPLGAHVLAGPYAGASRTDLYLVTNRPPEDQR